MLSIITGSYLIFWGPLFVVTVWHWSWGWEEAKKSLAHEVDLGLAPILFCRDFACGVHPTQLTSHSPPGLPPHILRSLHCQSRALLGNSSLENPFIISALGRI